MCLSHYVDSTAGSIDGRLLQLTDVKRGGGTVFPRLGVKLTPKKNSAAFWYNLKRNGEGIEDTVHGACPVLMGEKWGEKDFYFLLYFILFKWESVLTNHSCLIQILIFVCDVSFLFVPLTVANHWIRENGQIFKRKCSLDPEEWKSAQKIKARKLRL